MQGTGWVLPRSARLIRFIEHRVADTRVVRLIKKWLHAGVLEDGRLTRSEVGTIQGGSISPLLSNIYLHYAFNLWVKQWRVRHAVGDMMVVRYADDWVDTDFFLPVAVQIGNMLDREGECRARPQICASPGIPHVLRVIERAHGQRIGSVGQAGEEARHRQRDVARIVGFTEALPFQVFGPLEPDRQVTDACDRLHRGFVEEGRRGRADKRHVSGRGDFRDIAQ
ncbi:hypothetical protein WJ93_12985 [Burkholderia ubonensis]|nr:hypothetical protein WJ93_12985 [Burkholderia ubonensis]